MKHTRVLAPCQDTAQRKQRCRTLRSTLDMMISTLATEATDQVMHATGEQAHFGACLARACGYDALNETKQRACSMSKRNTVPPALPYSTSGYRDDGYAGGKQGLSERALIAREGSERNHAGLSSSEKDMRRIQTQEAAETTPDAKGPCQTKPVNGDDCWCAAVRMTQQPMR